MYARVYLLDLPYAADKGYDYLLPADNAHKAEVGDIAVVPFGKGEKRCYAVIAEITETSDFDAPKPILALLDRRFQLPKELFSVALFLKSHTLCTTGEAIRALLPPTVFSGVRESFSRVPTEGDISRLSLSERDEELLLSLLALLPLDEEALLSQLGDAGLRLTRRLVSAGVLLSTATPAPPDNVKTKWLYAPTPDAAERSGITPVPVGETPPPVKGAALPLRSAAQRRLLSVLLTYGEAAPEDACLSADATPAALMGLFEKKLLSRRAVEVLRNPYAALGKQRDTRRIVLSRAQEAAYDTLSRLEKEEKPAAALLYGVTGSGKTNVVLRLLDDVLSQKKTAIVMVPEIALTPQTVQIFCRRYGERVAVVHSSLSAGERFDAWRRIRDGEVELVIGTRSAVFAPLDNIGLIVIDEEHEGSYKSDKNPKYHARDVAAFRCGKHNALLVLASATPSVESFYKAEKGSYTLVPIRERYGNARLPSTVIVDMREELRRGNRSSLSEPLLRALRRAKEDEKQAILFLNRRGYNSAISCRGCGEAITCPHCSISLTYHTQGGGYLLCHACGYKSYPPRVCPSCGDAHLSYVGVGTEKAEAELATSLPDARVLRMDADTTGTRMAYERLLQSFRNGESDILVGTQMVTKGHDFPRVTVSGVLLADASLYVNDFRAGERTFSLLTQVIGRAGRGSDAGVAIIQTYAPENPVIKMAARQDYDGFYKDEIALRRETLFPPFCDLVQLSLSSTDEKAVLDASVSLSAELVRLSRESYAGLPLQAFGPFEAQTYKIGGKYRMRMVLKCRISQRMRALLSELLLRFGGGRGQVTLSVDINPTTV